MKRNLLRAIKSAALDFPSLASGVLGMLLVFVSGLWLPNLSLIRKILASPSLDFSDKIGFLGSLLLGISTNHSLFSASILISISILFGLNVAMLVFYVRSRRSPSSREAAVGIGGLVAGILGMGCAACGSIVLTSLVPIIGAWGIMAFLPLGGGEFGILGIALLLWSFYRLMRNISAPLVC